VCSDISAAGKGRHRIKPLFGDSRTAMNTETRQIIQLAPGASAVIAAHQIRMATERGERGEKRQNPRGFKTLWLTSKNDQSAQQRNRRHPAREEEPTYILKRGTAVTKQVVKSLNRQSVM